MRYHLRYPIVKAPVGGWKFTDRGFTFKSEHKDQLAAINDIVWQVTSFRREHHYPVGNPEQEMFAQMHQEHPHLFRARHESIEEHTAQNELCADCIRMYENGIQYADEIDIKKRIKTCLGCKMNIPIEEDNVDYDKMVFTICRSRVTEGLGKCSAFNHDNRIAVIKHYERYDITENADSKCWMRSEAKIPARKNKRA